MSCRVVSSRVVSCRAVSSLCLQQGGDRVYMNRLYLFREPVDVVEEKLQMQAQAPPHARRAPLLRATRSAATAVGGAVRHACGA